MCYSKLHVLFTHPIDSACYKLPNKAFIFCRSSDKNISKIFMRFEDVSGCVNSRKKMNTVVIKNVCSIILWYTHIATIWKMENCFDDCVHVNIPWVPIDIFAGGLPLVCVPLP